MNNLSHIRFTVNSYFSIKELLLIALMSLFVGAFIYFAFHYSRKKSDDKFFLASLVSFNPFFAFLTYVIEFKSSTLALVLCCCCVVAIYLAANKYFSKTQGKQLFLVWSAICGILCGMEKFVECAILCIIIFAILAVFRAFDDDMSRLLIVKGEDVMDLNIQALVFKQFNKKAKLVSTRVDEDGYTELVYRISMHAFESIRQNRVDVCKMIEEIAGVRSATIIKEEIANE